MIALPAGATGMVFASPVETLPRVREGRAAAGRGNGAAGADLPDTPATKECVPGYVALNWYAIIARLSETPATLRALPEAQARFAGTAPPLTGPERLMRLLEGDVPKWQQVAADAKIRGE